jgi:hypothetical protein
VGQTFTGTVVEIGKDGTDGVVVIADPAVEARVKGRVELGQEMTVKLVTADVATGTVKFEVA